MAVGLWPRTTRTSDPNSLLGRASDREVVLTRTLREKLMALNPGLPDAAYDDAVRQITAIGRIADPDRDQPREVRADARRRAGHLPQRQGRADAAAAAGV